MEFLSSILDLFLHLDRHLDEIIRAYGTWSYAILFLVIFAETGLVVTPFLPGDSLLFAAGTLAALGSLDPLRLTILLCVAANLGDTVNYWIGHFVGPKVFHRENVRFLKKEYLERTHRFYDRYGGRTIIIARFVPIVRTFAPFVAGIGRMGYGRFISYSVFAGIIWVTFFVYAGYLFGNIPAVRRHFSLAVLAIILISVIPMMIEFIRHRRQGR
ncbi:MAG: DedA family protein [Candidatus Zixiibacteriota bacterium]